MFISYAQNFEDVVLWRALRHIDGGFYVDIGAQDPIVDSVTLAFYERGWRGIHVEPTHAYAQKLRAARPDETVLEMAISDRNGEIEFNEIPDTGLSTASGTLAQQHATAGLISTKSNVKCMTLAKLFKKYSVRDIHFLKIDVEGLEGQVISGNDWQLYRPWVVVVEATIPATQIDSYKDWEAVLHGSSYQFVYADGLNRYYLANEHQDLSQRFKFPPNIFDGFINYRHAAAELRVSEIETLLVAKNLSLASYSSILSAIKKQHQYITNLAIDTIIQTAELTNKYQRASESAETMARSLSWRITSPLRRFNPQHRVLSIFQKVLRQHSSKTIYHELAAMNQVESTPPAPMQPQYIPVQIGNLEVLYASEALCDRRGIGRVSREILAHLLNVDTREGSADTANYGPSTGLRKVFFFPTVHWAPDKLPESSVVMIHDVIPLLFPKIFPDAVVFEWNNRLLNIAQQASCIVTISESSADDICRCLHVPRERIRVIYNGVTALPVSSRSSVHLPPSPYVAYLGSYDHHKNLDVVLQAMIMPEVAHVSLALIGDNASSEPTIRKLGLHSKVHVFGHIPDDDVGYIISNATAMMFPSLYEGFGLPPFEAALLGIPAVCSRRPAMTELLEDAALFADPHRPEEWSLHISHLVRDSTYREHLGVAAQSRAKQFTWNATVGVLIELLYSASTSA